MTDNWNINSSTDEEPVSERNASNCNDKIKLFYFIPIAIKRIDILGLMVFINDIVKERKTIHIEELKEQARQEFYRGDYLCDYKGFESIFQSAFMAAVKCRTIIAEEKECGTEKYLYALFRRRKWYQSIWDNTVVIYSLIFRGHVS